MFITPEIAKNRKESEKNLSNLFEKEVEETKSPLEIINPRAYDKSGNGNRYSDEFKTALGVAATLDGTLNAARTFGVNETTANDAKHGYRQDGNNIGGGVITDVVARDKVRALVEEKKENLVDKALDRMLTGIDTIAVDGTKADRAKAGTVKDLSTIVRNLVGQTNNKNGTQVQVVVFSPGQKDMSKYDVIET